jgi:hypothetical protein
VGPRYLKVWEYNEDEKLLEQHDTVGKLEDREQYIYTINLNKNEYAFDCLTKLRLVANQHGRPRALQEEAAGAATAHHH